MVGAVVVAYGPEKIIWKGLLYVVSVLVLSPFLDLIFGILLLKAILYASQILHPK
jgi:phosphate/sulfate permease